MDSITVVFPKANYPQTGSTKENKTIMKPSSLLDTENLEAFIHVYKAGSNDPQWANLIGASILQHSGSDRTNNERLANTYFSGDGLV